MCSRLVQVVKAFRNGFPDAWAELLSANPAEEAPPGPPTDDASARRTGGKEEAVGEEVSAGVEAEPSKPPSAAEKGKKPARGAQGQTRKAALAMAQERKKRDAATALVCESYGLQTTRRGASSEAEQGLKEQRTNQLNPHCRVAAAQCIENEPKPTNNSL